MAHTDTPKLVPVLRDSTVLVLRNSERRGNAAPAKLFHKRDQVDKSCMKLLCEFNRADWEKYLTEATTRFKKWDEQATEPQRQFLKVLGAPDFVADQITKMEAMTLIDQFLRERQSWRNQRDQQMTKPEPIRAAPKPKPTPEPAARPVAPIDPATGLRGTEAQNQWAERIKTSLSPYLQKLRNVAIPNSEHAELLLAAMHETDARFWIAYRGADMDPETLAKMLADVSPHFSPPR